MTCIYTGAIVSFPEYRTTTACDLYAVGDCTVICYIPANFYGETNRTVTHEAYIGDGFMNKNVGIIVIPNDQMTLKEKLT